MSAGQDGHMESKNGFESGQPGAPGWVSLAVIGLAATSVLGLVLAWSATTHARNAEQALGAQGKTLQQNADSTDTLNQRLAQEEESNIQLQKELRTVTDRLRMTQGEMTNGQKQNLAAQDEYSKKFDTVQSQLSGKANADDVTALGGDVNGVKSDLEATKNNLSMTRGEFGTLIARNHDEIDQLRRAGERDYFEFSLNKKGERSKVGSMMVELRSTNAKKNQFTVALYVDDMRLEKKNRSVDEPIYFYTRGTRTPLELVVNEVDKNKVSGYLSVPKPEATSASAATVAH